MKWARGWHGGWLWRGCYNDRGWLDWSKCWMSWMWGIYEDKSTGVGGRISGIVDPVLLHVQLRSTDWDWVLGWEKLLVSQLVHGEVSSVSKMVNSEVNLLGAHLEYL